MEIIALEKKHYNEVAKIYAEGLETGIASFETSIPEWEQWNEKFLPECRFVLIENQTILGWCTLSAISKREVYKGVAETTIYLTKQAHGKGLGKKLLNHLINESEKAGFWTLQARIFPQNIKSIQLHISTGFRIVGTKVNIAQRLGIWHDNVELERRSKKVNYMKNILVLCTGNSCRSQMAHGYLEKFAAGKAKIYSAGIETHGLNPGAVKTMADDGIDILKHTSNHVDEYAGIDWDYIITVCDHAHENCPFIAAPNAKRLHHNFSDPSKVIGSKEEISEAFIKTREEIKAYCIDFIAKNL